MNIKTSLSSKKDFCDCIKSGFTIVEVLIVVAVILITMAIALPPLHRWIVRYKVNQETATIYNTLTEMRFRSLAGKNGKFWGASFTTNSMTTFSWNDKNFDGLVTSDEEKTLSTYNLNYALVSSPALLWFDSRGVARRKTGGFYIQTIQIDTSGLPNSLDSYDCIAISANRIREGKLSGGTCNAS
ncbi:MAG: prepilin-type N-terminal cleavage/methylation domain-containing protein [Epsilonproteobacteria bacterium]|nr:prepilin-type N-terminal cleavage/methylation domain-containing protein [Campylobacterota bacterium]